MTAICLWCPRKPVQKQCVFSGSRMAGIIAGWRCLSYGGQPMFRLTVGMLSVSAISAGMLPAVFREFSCMPSVNGGEQAFQESPGFFHRIDFDGFTRCMRAVDGRTERDDVK